MAELIDESINLTLEKLNVQPELVEPKSWEQLRKIERVISEAFALQEKFKNEVRKTRPSKNNVASKSNIARQTIYNNELLNMYIEYRISEYNEIDPFRKNEKLFDRISVLEGQIKDMTERDVKIELMRRKISQLEDELKNNKQEKKELQEKYNNLKYNNKNQNEQKQIPSKVTVMPNLK